MTNYEEELKDKLRLSRLLNVILIVLVFGVGLLYMNIYNKNIQSNNNLSASIQSLNNQLIAQEMIFEKDYGTLYEDFKDLFNITHDICNQNQQLYLQNQDYSGELDEFRKREELYDKYSYAIYDRSGNRTDITYDQLILTEELAKSADISDPDLYLSWIMVESTGKTDATNSSSSAKGYPQFLDSTSKWVYTDLCGYSEDSWYPEIVYDGNISIEMMVAYINYLYEKNNFDLVSAIASYRGAHNESYISKINSYLLSSNKSIKDINLAAKNNIIY